MRTVHGVGYALESDLMIRPLDRIGSLKLKLGVLVVASVGASTVLTFLGTRVATPPVVTLTAAVAVELVDGDVDERVRRHLPDRAALPAPVVPDQVRDPVRMRRDLRADRGDRLDGDVRAGARGLRLVRGRLGEQEASDVEPDQDSPDRYT